MNLVAIVIAIPNSIPSRLFTKALACSHVRVIIDLINNLN